jgi:hypothetical protein
LLWAIVALAPDPFSVLPGWRCWRDLFGLVLLPGAVYVGVVLALFGREWLAQLRRRRAAASATAVPQVLLDE